MPMISNSYAKILQSHTLDATLLLFICHSLRMVCGQFWNPTQDLQLASQKLY